MVNNLFPEPGFELMTVQLMTSCLCITFLMGICIPPVNHLAPRCSQYSGGPCRGHKNNYYNHQQWLHSIGLRDSGYCLVRSFPMPLKRDLWYGQISFLELLISVEVEAKRVRLSCIWIKDFFEEMWVISYLFVTTALVVLLLLLLLSLLLLLLLLLSLLLLLLLLLLLPQHRNQLPTSSESCHHPNLISEEVWRHGTFSSVGLDGDQGLFLTV